MFERYTEKARRTIFFGRYEASQFGSPYIESEHLLLGLLREDKSLVNTFLHSHAALESIRRQVEERTVTREKVSTSVDLPLSNECKRILAYATEEADKLTHKFVGTGHLFLGVLREHDCLAAKLLRERGIALEMAREQIGSNPPEQAGHSPKSPGLPAGYTSHRLLYNWAAETLILELRASSSFLLATRLFVRRKDTEAYEQIGSPAEDVSYESPVTCGSHPVVVFNSLKRSKVGADWDGIYLYHLTNKELKLCVSPQTLRLSEAHGRNCPIIPCADFGGCSPIPSFAVDVHREGAGLQWLQLPPAEWFGSTRWQSKSVVYQVMKSTVSRISLRPAGRHQFHCWGF